MDDTWTVVIGSKWYGVLRVVGPFNTQKEAIEWANTNDHRLASHEYTVGMVMCKPHLVFGRG